MAASETECANLMLGHLGKTTLIQSLSTSRVAAAIIIRQIYDTVRKATLRDFNWVFAKRIEALQLITEVGDDDHPSDEYAFCYGVPSGCIIPRRIQSGLRMDNRQSRIPYIEYTLSDGRKTILTDQEDAILEYTFNVETVELFPDDFVLAFTLRGAVYAAPAVCGDDPFKLGDKAMARYNFEIGRAQNNSFTGIQADENPVSELERSRL